MIHTKWTKRLCDYWHDKRLADKCGLKVKDICVHEPNESLEKAKTLIGWEDGKWGKSFKCIKCGEFYR